MTNISAGMPLPPDHRQALPRRRLRRVSAFAFLLLCVGAASSWYLTRSRGANTAEDGPANAEPKPSGLVDSLARAPRGARIRLRVVNATDTRALARRATLFLRDLGYDVVEFDGDRRNTRATTLILAHASDTLWANRLQRAMNGSPLKSSPDSSHYVDFTVLLGRDWSPSIQPLRP